MTEGSTVERAREDRREEKQREGNDLRSVQGWDKEAAGRRTTRWDEGSCEGRETMAAWEANKWRRRDNGSHNGGGDTSGGGQIGLINFFGNEHYCLQRFLNISHDKSQAELTHICVRLRRLKLWSTVNQTACKLETHETWTLPLKQTSIMQSFASVSCVVFFVISERALICVRFVGWVDSYYRCFCIPSDKWNVSRQNLSFCFVFFWEKNKKTWIFNVVLTNSLYLIKL